MDLGKEQELVQQARMEFVSLAVADRGVPSPSSNTQELFQELEKRLHLGKNVAVHCRQGIGRSSLIAATLLILAGVDSKKAWENIQKAHGCPVPDTLEQKEWGGAFYQSDVDDDIVTGMRRGNTAWKRIVAQDIEGEADDDEFDY